MKHQRVQASGSCASAIFPDLPPSSPQGRVRPKSGNKSAKAIEVDISGLAAKSRAVKTTVMSFASMHRYGELFVNFMKARKSVFIEQLGWNLPQADGMEFDQYDTPLAHMVVVHEYGEVLAGIRLSPTTAKVGLHSYMLRDAQLGLLDGLPRDVLFFEAPVDATIWEATRVFISDTVGASRRPAIQRLLVDTMIKAANEGGAKSIIGIVPSLYARWLRRLDLAAVPVGPRFMVDRLPHQSILFNTHHGIQ